MKVVTNEELNGKIVTFTGRVVEPLNPDPDKINIVDIAHHLSMLCRFTGAVREFYSVAEHSVRVAQILPPRYRLWGLLHDAAEAYLGDFSRPVKLTEDLGRAYRNYEAPLQEVIAHRFGLSVYEPKAVKEADNFIVAVEQRDLMPPVRRHKLTGAYSTIEPWTQQDAKAAFLNMYEEITGEKPRR